MEREGLGGERGPDGRRHFPSYRPGCYHGRVEDCCLLCYLRQVGRLVTRPVGRPADERPTVGRSADRTVMTVSAPESLTLSEPAVVIVHGHERIATEGDRVRIERPETIAVQAEMPIVIKGARSAVIVDESLVMSDDTAQLPEGESGRLVSFPYPERVAVSEPTELVVGRE
ncbi:hypothetical protein [Natronorarus salvus]|uniref:hypothetical protein n=1 Tax=Natronorarus salvus TaxID=3117733 RepID=UPI002F265EDB